jgi:hypothetical protein
MCLVRVPDQFGEKGKIKGGTKRKINQENQKTPKKKKPTPNFPVPRMSGGCGFKNQVFSFE